LTGEALEPIPLIESPALAAEGRRGVAVCGESIEVCPGLGEDQSLIFHELTHIVQQRGPKAAKPAASPSPSPSLAANTPASEAQAAAPPAHTDPEAEAEAASAALVSGQPFQVCVSSSQPRLYEDGPPACALEGDTAGGDMASCPVEPSAALATCDAQLEDGPEADASLSYAEMQVSFCQNINREVTREILKLTCVQGAFQDLLSTELASLSDSDRAMIEGYVTRLEDVLSQSRALIAQSEALCTLAASQLVTIPKESKPFDLNVMLIEAGFGLVGVTVKAFQDAARDFAAGKFAPRDDIDMAGGVAAPGVGVGVQVVSKRLPILEEGAGFGAAVVLNVLTGIGREAFDALWGGSAEVMTLIPENPALMRLSVAFSDAAATGCAAAAEALSDGIAIPPLPELRLVKPLSEEDVAQLVAEAAAVALAAAALVANDDYEADQRPGDPQHPPKPPKEPSPDWLRWLLGALKVAGVGAPVGVRLYDLWRVSQGLPPLGAEADRYNADMLSQALAEGVQIVQA
jgi:hypothetical protein